MKSDEGEGGGQQLFESPRSPVSDNVGQGGGGGVGKWGNFAGRYIYMTPYVALPFDSLKSVPLNFLAYMILYCVSFHSSVFEIETVSIPFRF